MLVALLWVPMLATNPGATRAACEKVRFGFQQGSQSVPFTELPADLALVGIDVVDQTPTGLVPVVGPNGEPRQGVPVTLSFNSESRVVILPELEGYEGVYGIDFMLTPRSVPRGLPPENLAPDGEVTVTIDYVDDDCPDPNDASGTISFPPRNLHVADYAVVDYGDGDGFADPGEILDLFPRIVNNLGYDLTELRALVSSDDPGVIIVRGEATYGSLDAGDDTSDPATGPIRVVVTGEVAEGGRWPFRIQLHAAEFVGPSRVGTLTLATALDAPSDPGPGDEFLENFDSASAGGDDVHAFQLGSLFPVNTEALVDGSRCQTSDVVERPRNPSRCRPWKGSDWHLDTDAADNARVALSGDRALHLGKHSVVTPSLDDVSFGQLAAVVSPPIALGLISIPELSFWQIASLQQHEAGAVLQASTDGGLTWSTIHEIPINGPYDPAIDQPSPFFAPIRGCSFDPFDDGSTEDDRFDPPDPLDAQLGPSGPSSLCRGRVERPVHTWAFMGDSEFSNGISSGSEQTTAMMGSRGGAWVRSVANLQGYRGQTVRFRFLASTTNLFSQNDPDSDTGRGWASIPTFLPVDLSFTRGWFLDDVRVTGTAAAPVSLVADLEPPPPPAVVNVDPAPSAEEVELQPTVALAFSQPMDADTLSADTLTLTGPLGRVGASRSLLQDGLGARLVPDEELLDGTAYAVDAGSGLLNVAGVPLVPFSSAFTTAPFRATDPSRLHPPLDADVSGYAVPASIDIDQVSLRLESYDLGGGAEEPLLAAEVILANGGEAFEADSTITVYLDFGEEGLGLAVTEPGVPETQDVSLSVRFRNPATNRRASRGVVTTAAPVPRFSGFEGLGELSSVAPGRIVFRLRLADLLAAASDEQRTAAAAADDGTLTLRAWVTTRLRGDRDCMPDTNDNGAPTIASESLAFRFAAP